MKKWMLFLMLTVLKTVSAQSPSPQTAVENFFVAFHQRDTLAMRGFFHTDMVLETIKGTGDKAQVVREKPSEMLRGIASVPPEMKFEERILSWEIQSDGPLAQVWTPYEFYLNGKRSHGGVNLFVLFLQDGRWKILYLIDTRRG